MARRQELCIKRFDANHHLSGTSFCVIIIECTINCSRKTDACPNTSAIEMGKNKRMRCTIYIRIQLKATTTGCLFTHVQKSEDNELMVGYTSRARVKHKKLLFVLLCCPSQCTMYNVEFRILSFFSRILHLRDAK